MATYAEIEESKHGSAPIEIYHFQQSTVSWRFTSSDENKTVGGFEYTAEPMRRSQFEQSQNVTRAFLNVDMSKTNIFVTRFVSAPPTGIIDLTIYRYHEEQTDAPAPIWKGRVVNVKFGETNASVRCEQILTSLNRPTLRRLYQVGCPLDLYGTACRANRSNFTVATTVNSVSNVTIIIASDGGQPSGRFSGGYMTFQTSSGIIEERFITNHVGTTITVESPFTELPVNGSVNLFFGCGHDIADCRDTFNNLVNYGGMPFMIVDNKNPFGSTPIF